MGWTEVALITLGLVVGGVLGAYAILMYIGNGIRKVM